MQSGKATAKWEPKTRAEDCGNGKSKIKTEDRDGRDPNCRFGSEGMDGTGETWSSSQLGARGVKDHCKSEAQNRVGG